MISEKMKPLVNNNSAIRAMFEEGNQLKAIYGADKVYDFSLGNPNVPAPAEVKQAIIDILNEEESTMVHGYMSNAGFEDVRETIAQSLNRRFQTNAQPDHDGRCSQWPERGTEDNSESGRRSNHLRTLLCRIWRLRQQL